MKLGHSHVDFGDPGAHACIIRKTGEAEGASARPSTAPHAPPGGPTATSYLPALRSVTPEHTCTSASCACPLQCHCRVLPGLRGPHVGFCPGSTPRTSSDLLLPTLSASTCCIGSTRRGAGAAQTRPRMPLLCLQTPPLSRRPSQVARDTPVSICCPRVIINRASFHPPERPSLDDKLYGYSFQSPFLKSAFFGMKSNTQRKVQKYSVLYFGSSLELAKVKRIPKLSRKWL